MIAYCCKLVFFQNELDTKWHDFSREIQIFFLLVDMKNKAASLYPVKKTWLHCTFNLCYLIWGEDIYLKKKKIPNARKTKRLEESFKVFRVISKLLLEGRKKMGACQEFNTIK